MRHHSCVLVKNGEFHEAKSAAFSNFRPNGWIVLQWYCHRWDRGLHVSSMQFLEIACLIKAFPWWGIILAFWSKMAGFTRQNRPLSRIFDQRGELTCHDAVIDCISMTCLIDAISLKLWWFTAENLKRLTQSQKKTKKRRLYYIVHWFQKFKNVQYVKFD